MSQEEESLPNTPAPARLKPGAGGPTGTTVLNGGNEKDVEYGRNVAAIRLGSHAPGGRGAGPACEAEERAEVRNGRRAFACATVEETEDRRRVSGSTEEAAPPESGGKPCGLVSQVRKEREKGGITLRRR